MIVIEALSDCLLLVGNPVGPFKISIGSNLGRSVGGRGKGVGVRRRENTAAGKENQNCSSNNFTASLHTVLAMTESTVAPLFNWVSKLIRICSICAAVNRVRTASSDFACKMLFAWRWVTWAWSKER